MESISPEAFNMNLRGCFVQFGFWYFFILASPDAINAMKF